MGVILVINAVSMVAPIAPIAKEPKVWSDLVHGTLIAKTKGTFDKIETNAPAVVISKPDTSYTAHVNSYQ